MVRTSQALPLICALGALVAGCGHPASKQECESIFRRSAELALRDRQVTDPAEIKKRVAEVREAEGETLLKDCVGKRITDRAMQCVQDAASKQALEACLK